MKAVALRGVCIGVDRHLAPGEEADVDAATHQFLASIGAIAPAEANVDAAAEAGAETGADDTAKTEPKTRGAAAPKKGT